MATDTETSTRPRPRLTKQRVLRTAVALADRHGIDSLTMRRLAEELGVKAMSLYYHVANKEALLDGIVDVVVEEVEEAAAGVDIPDGDWKTEVRTRILTARQTMLRHPWAPAVIETRTAISPAVMRYFEALIGLLREGGFSYDLIHHAMHALGSRALGFSQELFEPDDEDKADEDISAMFEQLADQFPYMLGMLGEIAHDDPDSTLGWCDDQTEFLFGLDLILDGLERLLDGA